MAGKLYSYDADAHRLLETNDLIKHFKDNRSYYLKVAREIYTPMNKRVKAGGKTLRIGDFQPVLDAALKSDPVLEEAMNKLLKAKLNTGYNKWYGIFAAFLVYTEWTVITGEDKKTNEN